MKHSETNAMWSVLREMLMIDDKHGANRIQAPSVWFPILVEEVGEVATEIQNMADPEPNKAGDAYRAELVQVAATALLAIESYDLEQMIKHAEKVDESSSMGR